MKKKIDFVRFKRDAKMLMLKKHIEYTDIAKSYECSYQSVARFFSKSGNSNAMALKIALFLGLDLERYEVKK